MEIDVNTGDLYRVYAKVDLDAIRNNILELKKNISLPSHLMAVVKTDGYGHGAIEIAKEIEGLVIGFGTATLDEAVALREQGIKKMILILGYVHNSLFETMIKNQVSVNVYTKKDAAQLSQIASQLGMEARIHFKLDTGMSRLGVPGNQESLELLQEISKLPNIKLEGMFTHFACADEIEKTKTEEQLLCFQSFVKKVEEMGITIPFLHCSNSAGIIDIPQANFNMVRAGIAMYGLYPSEEVKQDIVHLVPALELKSHIVYIKEVEKGCSISYGATYTTLRKTRVATIPVGYGDGYPRALSNVGYVLVHGKKAPILGRICMDQFMVDVTDIKEAQEGDMVTLIGKDNGVMLSVEELASMVGNTFHYEIVCNLGKRVPRVFYKGNKAVFARPYLPMLLNEAIEYQHKE